jgi:alcohol dehydrogenase (NADP+)
LKVKAYGTKDPAARLESLVIERREPHPGDVLITIEFCGVCHSDIHQARNEWNDSIYPMVPGHEIVGTVSSVDAQVSKWKVGDKVGVGVLVDSCRKCPSCQEGEESYCEDNPAWTYNSRERDGTPTYGGYSEKIVVNQDYLMKIPSRISGESAAPLMCAGITTYSPLKHFGVGRGKMVAILGLGGLGHIGLKFAKAMGADVTVLSHSPGKKQDAERLGADDFIVMDSPSSFESNSERFDFILDTVSARHGYDRYLDLLRLDGTMALVGLPPKGTDKFGIAPESLIKRRRRVVGSQAGGIRETQEMLEFCGAHGIGASVEKIPIQQVNEAFTRTLKSDVRYRFVIDVQTLSLA